MELFIELAAVGLTAAIGENVVFSRALGHSVLLEGPDIPRRVLSRGLAVAFLATLAAFSGWLGALVINHFFPIVFSLRPPVYLVIYIALFWICLFLSRCIPARTPTPIPRLSTMVAFGYVPIGTLLVIGYSSYTLLQALVYGVGVGLGYLLALLLHHTIDYRLSYSNVPRALQGVPLTLIYFGMISLALFGIVGHQLAA